jgi:ribose 5-phosphate isomerase B
MLTEKIIIGADHAGFALKESFKSCLVRLGLEITDVGTGNVDSVDYPDFGCRVAAGVSCGAYSRGILVCGSGVGMTIIANKYPRVRAALCLDEETAEMSRRHNDTNILCLAGRKTDPEKAEKIMEIWLKTAFEGGRHIRRIEKIREIEKEVCARQNEL